MELKETMLSREEIFKGKIFSVQVDTVRLPDGKTTKREVVRHGGGAAVLALDGDGNALTVRQYRYVFETEMVELPAGKIDPGEDPEVCAARELKEETGAAAGRWDSLGYILPSPGCYSEKLYMFLARDLRMEGQHLDPGEFLNVEKVPFVELYRRCMEGEIHDAKTVTAVLKAKLLLGL